MKKLMLVMLLGLSSTVALQAAERSAPASMMKDELRESLRHQFLRFLGHAKKQDLVKFEEFLQDVFPGKSLEREQRFEEGASAPMSRESSVVFKDAPKKELELPQPASEKALAKMTPARRAVVKAAMWRDKKLAVMVGEAARRKMGDSIQINANMKQMGLLHEMVESYEREGNHAMIDFCLTLFSRVDLGEIGLTHGDMGQWLMQKKSAPERARGAASSAQQKK